MPFDDSKEPILGIKPLIEMSEQTQRHWGWGRYATYAAIRDGYTNSNGDLKLQVMMYHVNVEQGNIRDRGKIFDITCKKEEWEMACNKLTLFQTAL